MSFHPRSVKNVVAKRSTTKTKEPLKSIGKVVKKKKKKIEGMKISTRREMRIFPGSFSDRR